MRCEFSLSHYKEILQAVKGNAGTVDERKRMILTHDVDISPRYALDMARMEYRHDIKATYYILLHSEWYNALSPENIAILQEIKELGHELALHYNGDYDGELDTIHRAFSAIFDSKSRNVSQHLRGITKDIIIPPTLHDRYDISGYEYIADSGGWWRNGCVCQHLDKKLMFLCHPFWWVRPDFAAVVKDGIGVLERARHYWEDMINEHRKQQVRVASRSA